MESIVIYFATFKYFAFVCGINSQSGCRTQICLKDNIFFEEGKCEYINPPTFNPFVKKY